MAALCDAHFLQARPKNSYGTYKYTPKDYGPYSYGLCSHGLYRYGLCRYGLYSYGLYSYGLYGPKLIAPPCSCRTSRTCCCCSATAPSPRTSPRSSWPSADLFLAAALRRAPAADADGPDRIGRAITIQAMIILLWPRGQIGGP